MAKDGSGVGELWRLGVGLGSGVVSGTGLMEGDARLGYVIVAGTESSEGEDELGERPYGRIDVGCVLVGQGKHSSGLDEGSPDERRRSGEREEELGGMQGLDCEVAGPKSERDWVFMVGQDE